MRTSIEVAHLWFNEVWNQQNLDMIPELMAADAQGHLEGGREIVGPDQFIEFQKSILGALPDIRIEILNSLSNDEYSCVMWKSSAKNDSITFRGTTWLKVHDGKVVEGWDCWNHGALMTTLASL